MSYIEVTETFWLTNRGLVVAFDHLLPNETPRELEVDIVLPSGATLRAHAVVEFLCRSVVRQREVSALLLPEVPRDSVPVGSRVSFAAERSPN